MNTTFKGLRVLTREYENQIDSVEKQHLQLLAHRKSNVFFSSAFQPPHTALAPRESKIISLQPNEEGWPRGPKHMILQAFSAPSKIYREWVVTLDIVCSFSMYQFLTALWIAAERQAMAAYLGAPRSFPESVCSYIPLLKNVFDTRVFWEFLVNVIEIYRPGSAPTYFPTSAPSPKFVQKAAA